MNQIEYKPVETMRSSYKENNYGRKFEIMVLAQKPRLIVECGILDGYSLLHFAKATKLNSEADYFNAHVIAFDLFDKYDYKHGNVVDVHNMLKHEGVADYVTLLQGDAYEVHTKFEDEDIDMLHIDISNDGQTFLDIFELWGSKISKGGCIICEGGSEDRDNVEWMKKYNKKPIRSIFKLLAKRANNKWQISILGEWPSITVMRRIK